MTDTSKALELADLLGNGRRLIEDERQEAAAELRRLDAVEREIEQIRALEPVGSVFTMEALDGRGVEKSHATLTKSLPAGTKLFTLPPNLKG